MPFPSPSTWSMGGGGEVGQLKGAWLDRKTLTVFAVWFSNAACIVFPFPPFFKVVRILNWHLQTSERQTDVKDPSFSVRLYSLLNSETFGNAGWMGYVVCKDSICMLD